MVFDRVKEIVIESLNAQEKEVVATTTLEDLGADSIDAVEMIMALEEEYDLEISEDDAKAFTSLQSIVDYIESNK